MNNIKQIIFWLLLILFSENAFAIEKANSILVTNYNNHLTYQNEVRHISIPIQIYDIGYIVYSKEFAERFGYPAEYISDLAPGMQALEFRVQTKGAFVECHINTLLDNTLGLDLPKQDFDNHFERQGDMIRFPQKLDSTKDRDGWYKENPEDKTFRVNITQEKMHYYGRNIYLASLNYFPGKPNTWAFSSMLESYTSKYIKGLNYLSINLTCGDLAYKNLQKADFSLWIKKRGGDDYTKVGNLKPDQFIKFAIPPTFSKKAADFMESVTQYNFFKNLELKEGVK